MNLRRTNTGFSLLEGLVVTALVGLFLVIVSDLTIGLRSATTLADSKDDEISRVKELLGSVELDIREAVEIVSPLPGRVANDLDVRRYTADAVEPSTLNPRLPEPPSERYVQWDPYQSSFLESRRYAIESGELFRRGSGGSSLSFGEVQSFQVERIGDRVFEIIIVLPGKNRERKASLKVVRF